MALVSPVTLLEMCWPGRCADASHACTCTHARPVCIYTQLGGSEDPPEDLKSRFAKYGIKWQNQQIGSDLQAFLMAF
jgi:hypothetical protein